MHIAYISTWVTYVPHIVVYKKVTKSWADAPAIAHALKNTALLSSIGLLYSCPGDRAQLLSYFQSWFLLFTVCQQTVWGNERSLRSHKLRMMMSAVSTQRLAIDSRWQVETVASRLYDDVDACYSSSLLEYRRCCTLYCAAFITHITVQLIIMPPPPNV